MGNARVALPRGLLAFMLAVVAWGAAHPSEELPRAQPYAISSGPQSQGVHEILPWHVQRDLAPKPSA